MLIRDTNVCTVYESVQEKCEKSAKQVLKWCFTSIELPESCIGRYDMDRTAIAVCLIFLILQSIVSRPLNFLMLGVKNVNIAFLLESPGHTVRAGI